MLILSLTTSERTTYLISSVLRLPHVKISTFSLLLTIIGNYGVCHPKYWQPLPPLFPSQLNGDILFTLRTFCGFLS